MANTHGGLIAYGVAERGDCRADRIVSLGAIAEDVYQNIRRVASNLIHPPVVGLHFHYLASADNSESVLALSIPESLDSPHLVRPKNQPQGQGWWFAAPYRNGRTPNGCRSE